MFDNILCEVPALHGLLGASVVSDQGQGSRVHLALVRARLWALQRDFKLMDLIPLSEKRLG